MGRLALAAVLAFVAVPDGVSADPLVYRKDDGNWNLYLRDVRSRNGHVEVLYQSQPLRGQPDAERLGPRLALMAWEPAATPASSLPETRSIVTSSGPESDLWQSDATLAGSGIGWRAGNELRLLDTTGAEQAVIQLAKQASAIRGIDGTEAGEVVVVTHTSGGTREQPTSRLVVHKFDPSGKRLWRTTVGDRPLNHILQHVWSTADGGALLVIEARDSTGGVLRDIDDNPGDQVVRGKIWAVRVSRTGQLQWQTLLAVNKQQAEARNWDPALMQMEGLSRARFAQNTSGAMYLLFERSSTLKDRRGYFVRRLDEPALRGRDIALDPVEESLDIHDINGLAAAPGGGFAIAGMLTRPQHRGSAGFVARLTDEGELSRAHLSQSRRLREPRAVFSGSSLVLVGLTTKAPYRFVLEAFPPDAPTYTESEQALAEKQTRKRRKQADDRRRQQLKAQAQAATAQMLGADPEEFAEMTREERKALKQSKERELHQRADKQFANAFGMNMEDFEALSPEEQQRIARSMDPAQIAKLMRHSQEQQAEAMKGMNELADKLRRSAATPNRLPGAMNSDASQPSNDAEAWRPDSPYGGTFEFQNPGDGPLTLVLRRKSNDKVLIEKHYGPGEDVYEYLDLSRTDAQLSDLTIEIQDEDGKIIQRFRIAG